MERARLRIWLYFWVVISNDIIFTFPPSKPKRMTEKNKRNNNNDNTIG